MNLLQYVHVDGYCWFNTGIYPDINTKIEVDYIEPVADMGSWCCDGFVGAQNGDDSTSTFQIREQGEFTDNKLWVRVGNKQVESQTTATVFTNVSVDKDYFISNGETVSVGTTLYDTCNYPLIIGGINNPSWSHKRASNANIGEVKIYSSGVLVGDFIPAEHNGVVGYYDDVNSTFISKSGTGTPTAGPSRSSISVEPTSVIVGYAGDTISVDVFTENSWVATPTDGTWITLSSNSGTGDDTITIDVDPNGNYTDRIDTITFVDMNTTDEVTLTIKQKKYSDGQPMYIGTSEISEFYLGSDTITEMYLGDVLVFSATSGGGGDECDSPECQECIEQGGTWDAENQTCEGVGCNCDPECMCQEAGGTWIMDNCDCMGDPECECVAQGGTWDGESCTGGCGGGESECDSQECEECVQNGGTWIIPEIGDPYCQYPPDYCDSESPDYDEDACNCISAGGVWEYDSMSDEYYCDCGGDPECECIQGGGTWDDTNQECTYPE